MGFKNPSKRSPCVCSLTQSLTLPFSSSSCRIPYATTCHCIADLSGSKTKEQENPAGGCSIQTPNLEAKPQDEEQPQLREAVAPTEMEDEVLILNVEVVTRKTPAMVMVLAAQAMLEEAMAFYAMVITSIGKSNF